MPFSEIFDWTEAWAPAVPFLMAVTGKKLPKYFTPVTIYFFLALLFNTVSDFIWKQNSLKLSLPTDNNNPIYNLQSILRLLLFSDFFIRLNQPFMKGIKKALPFFFGVFVLVDLLIWENFFARKISNNIHAVEAGVLLFYCLIYYLFLLRGEALSFKKLPSFWVVTGLIIFVAISFPIYLYYNSLIKRDEPFAIDIWKVEKISFFTFCMLSAVGVYVYRHSKSTIE